MSRVCGAYPTLWTSLLDEVLRRELVDAVAGVVVVIESVRMQSYGNTLAAADGGQSQPSCHDANMMTLTTQHA
jgi:hypothetical protein